MVHRILGSTTSPTTTTTNNGGGNENVNLRWEDSNSRPESGDNGVESQQAQSHQSQGLSRQQKMSCQEALAQILEYHREGLTRITGRKSGTDSGGDECRGDEDGDHELGKRKRRDSDDDDVDLDRHGVGHTSNSTTQQQQRTCRQPPPASSASDGPSASTSSSIPWSSSTMTNNALSFVPFGEDEDDPPSPSLNVNEGLHVYTVGHLMPRNS
jgi:hypothetical protein